MSGRTSTSPSRPTGRTWSRCRAGGICQISGRISGAESAGQVFRAENRMEIVRAGYRDVRSWLDLAAEVEPLFGPMLDDPGFYQALLRNIERGTAFCVREGGGPPGTPLLGAMLFSLARPERPEDRIVWLAVAERGRRRGIGTLLGEHACGLVASPGVLSVVTFGEDN